MLTASIDIRPAANDGRQTIEAMPIINFGGVGNRRNPGQSSVESPNKVLAHTRRQRVWAHFRKAREEII
jgi:hypothetical protein